MTTPPVGTASPDPRLRMFSLLMAVASLTHMVSFPWWLGLISGQVLLAATLALLFFPGTPAVLLGFLAASLTYWFGRLPAVPNHILFEMLVHGTLGAAILAAAGAAVWRSRRPRRATKEQLLRPVVSIAFEQARPLIITELVVMYLYTVLHKLNEDFLNPAVSCAVSMHHELAEVVPWIPDGEWTWWPTILGTLVIELAIPLLFLSRRTRTAGLLVGLVFHHFLALHPHGGIYSFSGLLFALYALLLPDAVLRRIGDRWMAVPLAARVVSTLVVVAGFGVTVFLQLAAYRSGDGFSAANAIGYYGWLPLALLISGVYIVGLTIAARTRSKVGEAAQAAEAGAEQPWRPLWIFPVLVLVNGACPYLDLKTTTAFSMFSNLRTEDGHNNHLFLPRLPLFGYQDDLVEVLQANDPRLAGLARSGDLLPWFEFRRIASSTRLGTVIRCRRNGEELMLSRDDESAAGREAFTPHPWWMGKFLVFRPIRPFGEPMTCRH
jgi:hypothetical protein